MRILTAAIGVVSAMAVFGCSDSRAVEEPQFYIQQNTKGILDVSMGMGYWLSFVMVNTLTPTTSGNGQPERNALMLKGFEVELDLQGMEKTVGWNVKQEQQKFWWPGSGYLSPGGKLSSRIQVIPDWLAVEMKNGPIKPGKPKGGWPVIHVLVTAVASKTGNEVESPFLVYPIMICNECLVEFLATCPPGIAPSKDKGKTVKLDADWLPQDKPSTCCKHSDGRYYCKWK